MHTILLVDDERTFLLSLRDGLRGLDKNLGILLAGDGREAIEILGTQKVDLLVTDLNLPHMNGFELLAHVSSFHAELPIIVMTAHGTPEMEERLARMQALHYLEKPLELDQLAETIDSALQREAPSYIRGITLATFLQLMNMEQKSCTLKVQARERTGYLFIRRGEIIDAQLGSESGKDVALEIIAWDDTEIEMDATCRRAKKVIEEPFSYLLMEAHRLKDESPPATRPPSEEFTEAGKEVAASPPVIPLHRDNPPGATDKKPAAVDPDLVTRLAGLSAIQEFVIFNEVNILVHQSTTPSALAELNPSFLLMASDTLGDSINGGTLQYLLLSNLPRQKFMALRVGRYKVFLALTATARIPDLAEDLFTSPNTPFAQGGLNAADYR